MASYSLLANLKKKAYIPYPKGIGVLDSDEHFDVYNALMEDCELIANEEFNHIIGELKTAVGIIDGGFK
jgi:hypothetical protein